MTFDNGTTLSLANSYVGYSTPGPVCDVSREKSKRRAPTSRSIRLCRALLNVHILFGSTGKSIQKWVVLRVPGGALADAILHSVSRVPFFVVQGFAVAGI